MTIMDIMFLFCFGDHDVDGDIAQGLRFLTVMSLARLGL